MHHLDSRLIIFTRFPIIGQTKTRLIPLLGPVRAADLQRRLTEKIVNIAKQTAGTIPFDIRLYFEGGSVAKMSRWLGKSLPFTKQTTGDIGSRMFYAFKSAFQEKKRRVVLMGTDIAGISRHDITDAFNALTTADIVLGPSNDGGYWLIGMKRPIDLFTGISWSTDRVLRQTENLARASGFKTISIDRKIDIDTPQDLEDCGLQAAETAPYISVIIPTLNESPYIRSAIESARHPAAQIIIADGGSHDDTCQKAARATPVMVTSPPGRGTQQNHGASIAQGRMLLFLHADSILPENYVASVYKTFLDSRVIMGAFRFKIDIGGRLMRLFTGLTNFRAKFLQLPYGDQAFFLPSHTFQTSGGFPEVPIAEDLFFVRKLAQKGRIAIAPSAVITSGRRLRQLGILRTVAINQCITAGCFLGVSPEKLAPLYRLPGR